MIISPPNLNSDARPAGGLSRARVPGPSGAFSLVEILVTVALLSFIILGLVAMFSQTQKAFTTSVTQADILGSGRAATDMIAREIEQTTIAGYYNVTNFFVASYNQSPPAGVGPILMTANTDRWTNDFQQVYFLTRNNQQWNGIGYKFVSTDMDLGVAALYRYASNNIPFVNLPFQVQDFQNDFASGNVSKLIDGIVDFRIRVYDTNGYFLQMTNKFFTNSTSTIYIQTNSVSGAQIFSAFRSNAVPAYVEVELGVLEDRTLARFRSLTNSTDNTAARNYLSTHPGAVHIFRQRIPIRNVNPAAYP